MTFNASQIINNLKKSFNAYVETQLGEASINFDDDSFDTSSLDSWYAVRYTGLKTESSGMGNLTEPDSETKGKFHVLECEVSAWHRDDPQRVSLGDMVDILIAVSETGSIPLYDFSDPEDPEEIGSVHIRPIKGSFAPNWNTDSLIWKSSGDTYASVDLVGFVLEMELITLAEVS